MVDGHYTKQKKNQCDGNLVAMPSRNEHFERSDLYSFNDVHEDDGGWALTKQNDQKHWSLLDSMSSSLFTINELAEAILIEVPPAPQTVDQSDTGEARWSPNSANQRKRMVSSELIKPERSPSFLDEPVEDDRMIGASMDVPVRAPTRANSIELDFEFEDEDGL